MTFQNETWLVDEGDRAIVKMANSGMDSLTAWERLVYAFWVADYGMRNAGDLVTAEDICHDFRSIAVAAAGELSLKLTEAVFSLEPGKIEEIYFDRFDEIFDEIRDAKASDAPP